MNFYMCWKLERQRKKHLGSWLIRGRCCNRNRRATLVKTPGFSQSSPLQMDKKEALYQILGGKMLSTAYQRK